MSTTPTTPNLTTALEALKTAEELQRRERLQLLAPAIDFLFARSQARYPKVPAPEPEPPVDEVVARCQKAIADCTNICDGGKRDIARVVSAFLGKEVTVGPSPKKPLVGFPRGFFIVPSNNPNGHNYPLGKASMVAYEGGSDRSARGLRPGAAGEGNWLLPVSDTRFEWRAATRDEVAETVTSWTDAQVRGALELP